MIGVNRVKTDILERIGLQLSHQPDAAALLMFVDQQPASFVGNRLHRQFQLASAVAAQRAKHFAGQALRMDSNQRNALCHVAQNERKRGFNPPVAIRDFALERHGPKHPPFGRHSGIANSSHRSGLRSWIHLRVLNECPAKQQSPVP